MLRLRTALVSTIVLIGLAAGCGSDDASDSDSSTASVAPTVTSDANGSEVPRDSATDESSAPDPTTEQAAGTDAASADTGAGGAGDGSGGLDITFTVLASEKNPSLNGKSATVKGSCNVSTSNDILFLEGGTDSDASDADRPNFITFIGGAPDDGKVEGLLRVVEDGLESSTMGSTGTFDGTTMLIVDDESTPILRVELSEQCVSN